MGRLQTRNERKKEYTNKKSGKHVEEIRFPHFVINTSYAQ